MFRIDNHSTLHIFQYNLTHFNESSYYYDLGASTITFSRKKTLSCQNLAYIFVKPFLFAFAKVLNFFSHLNFLRNRPAQFSQITSKIYTGAPPSNRNARFLNKIGIKGPYVNIDSYNFRDRNELRLFIRQIQIQTNAGNIYLYSNDKQKRLFVANLIHYYYGNKPTNDPQIFSLGLKLEELQGHTQDIYSGPVPIFRSDFELLETENIKTVVYFGNQEIPEEAKGLGLTYISFKFTDDDFQKCAELIVSRSRFGSKLYFCSPNPAIMTSLVLHIRRVLPEEFRSFQQDQALLTVPLD